MKNGCFEQEIHFQIVNFSKACFERVKARDMVPVKVMYFLKETKPNQTTNP